MGAMTRTADRQDPGLLASAVAGDEVAFRRIIAAYHEDMRRVCHAIAADDAIADEAVQAAWLVAWKKLGKVRGPAQLRPWLVSVAVREAKQLLRNRRRRAEVEVIAERYADARGPDSVTDAAALDLRAALTRLGPDDAALLALRYVAGFDSNELALATGISPSGTRTRIERLLKRLREDLGDD
jgi:RNA polymerase sigma-70 factor (ECF subfamily)